VAMARERSEQGLIIGREIGPIFGGNESDAHRMH
jgi:hypothetical protein